MKEEWSKWAAVLVLAQVGGLLAYEFYALRTSGDSWPTITAMSVAVMKKYWWALIAILGTIMWLFLHLLVRVVKKQEPKPKV